MRVNNGTKSPLKPKTTITFQTDLAYDVCIVYFVQDLSIAFFTV